MTEREKVERRPTGYRDDDDVIEDDWEHAWGVRDDDHDDGDDDDDDDASDDNSRNQERRPLAGKV